MAAALRHRGPDGCGEQPAAGAAGGGEPLGWIGHRRLAVIDLTDAAAQPMVGRGGSVVLVFNGVVYNFRELRRDLEARGHAFASSGDTEVVLRAYLEWEDAFVERLDGMFALAVWDGDRGRLLLARDRTGKKPLFYVHDGRGITFASEVKALAAAPWIRLAPRLDRLPAFLAHGYVPGPDTFYEGVRQVAPATLLAFDARSGGVAERQYWDPLPRPPLGRSGPDVARDVRALMERATRRRLVADVPVGALLSGGVDSSLVTALAAQADPERVSTFSVGFGDEASFDERPWAQLVAQRLGTRHHAFEVRPDAVALLDRLIWLHDGPFADSSAIPTYLVCEMARDHVTVVLTGDGGDEVFAGYERFAAAAVAERVPRWVDPAIRASVGLLPRRDGYHALRARVERFAAPGARDLGDRYFSWVSVFAPDVLDDLLAERPPAGSGADLRAHYDAAAALPWLDRILYANLRTYLPDDLHVKVDRMSMAHGLEARSPFLDTALVERVSRVRARDRIGLRQVKPLLRAACEPLVPPEVWDRRKHGFGVPMGRWMREDLRPLVEDELLAADSRVRPLLREGAVGRLWAEHTGRRRDHGGRLWTLLTLERWLRDCERPEPLAEPAPPELAAARTTAG